MKILALDLATNTGWARNYGAEPRYGVVKFKGMSRGLRFCELWRFLAFATPREQPELVVFETPHMRGGAATRSCVGMAAVVEMYISEFELKGDEYRPDAVKRFACGSGKASKEQMIEAAKALGYSPKNDNDADAIHLLLLAESNLKTKEQ